MENKTVGSGVSAGIPPADILTPAEVAARLKVKPAWIYNKLRERGKDSLPHIKMGRYLRFSWSAVSAWLESQQRPARKGARA